jgi:hypothetical protein
MMANVGSLLPCTAENALSQCGRFLLKLEEASDILASVREVVSGWRQGFAEADVSRTDLGIWRRAFRPTGKAPGRLQHNPPIPLRLFLSSISKDPS